MRLLVVGGCGMVGSMVLPRLAKRTRAAGARPRRAGHAACPVSEYYAGDLHDVDLVASLAGGVDSLVFMAMGPMRDWGSPATARAHLDVAVPGMYATLTGAHRAGVRHVVYTSSMSVYRYPLDGREPPPDQAPPPTSGSAGSRTRRSRRTRPSSTAWPSASARTVCRNATVAWDMDVVCLRLCFPTADDELAAPGHGDAPGDRDVRAGTWRRRSTRRCAGAATASTCTRSAATPGSGR